MGFEIHGLLLDPCRAKKGTGSKLAAPPVTFRDVAGLDTAKEELLEVVACLRDARRYARLNAKTPSGVLLTGPPGTGKTLLGKSSSLTCVVLIALQGCQFHKEVWKQEGSSVLAYMWTCCPSIKCIYMKK